MDKYQQICVLGDGSFGTVTKEKDIDTGEIVAIKKFKQKYTNWDECKNLREVKSLVNLKHDNIVKLKEMIRVDNILYLVFEYLDNNLYELLKSRMGQGKKLSESQVRTIMYQIVKGIEHMHKYGFFHRDLKPENIMVSGDKVKLADFGLAREIRSIPPYTDYVATRWYRAPECALKSSNYNSPVDIWALGAIMAELITFKPLFPGGNERDLLLKICSIIGSPTSSTWPEGLSLAKKIGLSFPSFPGGNLSTVIPDTSNDAISLMSQMLEWDPNKRLTATQILQHPFFTNNKVSLRISTPEIKNKININNNIEGIRSDVRKKSKVLMNSSINNFANEIKKSSKDVIELKKKDSGKEVISKFNRYIIKMLGL